MSDPFNYSKLTRGGKIAVIIGVILVVYGAAKLILILLPQTIMAAVQAVAGVVSRFIWPASFLILGIAILWFVASGRYQRARDGRQYQGSFARCTQGKCLAGVCGGLARHFGINAAVVRVLTVLLALSFPVATLITYAITAFLTPER